MVQRRFIAVTALVLVQAIPGCISVAVVVENSGEGSVFAAPICRQVMEAFLFGPPAPETAGGE